MKTTYKILAVLMLALTAFGPAAGRAAAGSAALIFRGPSALASFSSTDQTGCVVTEASVFATDGLWLAESGPGSALSFATVVVSQYDVCNQTQVLLAYGNASPLTVEAFEVTPQLDAAHLQGTAYVFDEVSGMSYTMDIDLTWTGAGALTRTHNNDRFHSPGCVLTSHLNEGSRPAQVTGSISDGTTNFAPEPAYQGSLARVVTGTVLAGCQ